METVLAIALGLGLAAACGFRVFVPMLIASVAAYSGHVELTEGMAWIGSPVAMVVFGVATTLEIGAYYVPWLDNLLDTVSTPSAVVAGALLTGAFLTDMSPMMRWTAAIIAGGGTSGAVAGGMSLVRAASTTLTGGVGNPVVATVETGSSFVLAIVAVVAPLLAIALAVIAGAMVTRRLGQRRSAA